MSKRKTPFRFEPVRAIEWVIIAFTTVGALYIFSPLYDMSMAAHHLTPFAAALSSQNLIYFFGAALLIGVIMVVLGIKKEKPQFRSVGWFTIMLTRLFQVLTTILTIGVFPISWIYPLTLSGIILVLWIVARAEVKRRATS